MLTQAHCKGKQKSSAIPTHSTQTNGKLEDKAFNFHFLFSLNAALSSVNPQQRKASASSRMTLSPSVSTTHNTSALGLLGPLTLTQVPLKLCCMNLPFQRKLTESKYEVLLY